MKCSEKATPDVGQVIFVPFARGRALSRAVLWSVPALLLGAAAFVVYSRLHLVPTAVSNRIVDYAVAFAALPIPLLAALCGFRAGRYLLSAVWPRPMGVYASDGSLDLRMGPFGASRLRAAELSIRYPFELSGDLEDGGFERYLPEEEQVARLLPRITHPRSSLAINRTILQFVAGDEVQIARSLLPKIVHWRAANPSDPRPTPIPNL